MKDAFLLPCSFADLEIRYQHIPAYRYQEATNHTSNAMDQDHLVAALAQWGRQWERPPKVVTGKPGRPPKKSKVVEKKRSDIETDDEMPKQSEEFVAPESIKKKSKRGRSSSGSDGGSRVTRSQSVRRSR